MYKKVEQDMNFVPREIAVQKFWEQNEIFRKSVQAREGGKEFSFYDGPPTANGKPHIGHILTRVMKDIIPRYKTMKGYHVLRKAGWDTHGLPVELEVEKTLGIDGKQDIERYGVEPFIEKCKESVWKYKGEWERMSGRVGYWADMENPYVTYDDNYIESVWWSLSEIYKKGLIYKGHKIVPYCPRCGTALSSHEVAQGYKDVTEKSAVVKFAAEGEENTYILAWTTTPWTLPSNVALCVHPDFDYAYVKSGEETYILAAELVSSHFENAQIIKTVKGRALEKKRYNPLFNHYKKDKQDCFYITLDEYVTLSDGTGVVHIAPAFGEDDARIGRAYALPFVQLVDTAGRFCAEAGELAGIFCKDADKLILKDLEARGLLKSAPEFTHSYPFCWRCDTPLLYYARSTWFIKMTEVKERLLECNASVNWIPEAIGKGRMGNFLENVIDWGLSRERYWGTPLPIWVCPDCGKTRVIGSKAELKEAAGLKENDKIELHKPYVDALTVKCGCGGEMRRTPEVIDCWYDSGSMPFAQYHYPFENKETFEATFPANFISEAVDQTRGWFYTLLAISTLLFDKAPFESCIVLGHVNDKDGIKMSKHKGNVVDPWSVLDAQGADAVRWYFYTSSMPWLPSRFYPEAVSEAQRKFLGTLYNVYSFYVQYAEIDAFDPTKYSLEKCSLTLMDKWILSALNSLVKTVDEGLAEYKITESARAVASFTDSLSNWYVRRCRERFWAGGMDGDKQAAFTTLYTVLDTVSKVIAPFTPFLAEEIYRNINLSVNKKAPESVHLTDFPKPDKSYIDKKLEAGMQICERAAVLGRAARNAASVKIRQPLGKVIIAGGEAAELAEELKLIIADELNVKEIESAEGVSKFVTAAVKPQLKTLGPKYGALIGQIRNYLAQNGDVAAAAVKDGGVLKITLSGKEIELSGEDLLITLAAKPGYAAESDGGMTVILDSSITEELRREGIMRELVSKIQTLRKESGFEVTDRIALTLCASKGDEKALGEVLSEHSGRISKTVLADEITISDNAAELKDVNGLKIGIAVKKL